MNDKWFDEYMFEVAVPRKVLKEEHLKALDTKPVVLPAWDVSYTNALTKLRCLILDYTVVIV